MVSRILRRSGFGFLSFSEWLEWKPDLVVQIGVGLHHQEVDVMREAWPACKFVGFEAHPGIYDEIKDEYPGQLHNYAISNLNERRVMFERPRHKDGSSLYPHVDKDEKRIETVSKRLDDFVFCKPELGGKCLLWLDCEGSELEALLGGMKLLKNVDVVNVELTSKPRVVGGCTPGEVHALLLREGFLRQWHHTSRSAAGQCDAIYVRRSLFRPDLCCCPCQQELYEKGKK